MTNLKTPVDLDTAFTTYRITEQIGEGGAGRVFGGTDPSGIPVAVKVLTASSTDKRKRFKNEISFLINNKHKNIVSVIDYGIANSGNIKGPFYVMPRFASSLRAAIEQRVPAEKAILLYSQLLNGVEAAHMQGVIHRDLKPENILISHSSELVSVADFGVAHFTAELLHTAVETAPAKRLANFAYAAPEQRTVGRDVNSAADIWALGLMLNELFTAEVPHGTEYKRIAEAAPEFGFLDPIVAEMLRQNPSERPASIANIKELIQRYRSEAVSLQKLNALRDTVIPAGEVDEHLAHEAPRLINARYENNQLNLTLDRPINDKWLRAFRNMGHYTSIMGIGPETFDFRGNIATVRVAHGDSAQQVINYFKEWLPVTTRVLKSMLEQEMHAIEAKRREELRRAREAEEKNLAINRSLRV